MTLNKLRDELEKLKKNEHYVYVLMCKIRNIPIDQAMAFYEIGIDYTRKNNLMSAHSWLIYILGWAYIDKNEMDRAQKVFEEARVLFEERKDNQGMVALCNAYISIYLAKGEIKKVLEYGFKGLELAQQIEDNEYSTKLKYNLAAVYMDLEEYEEAVSILIKSKRGFYLDKKSDEDGIHLNLLICYVRLGRLDEAAQYAEILEGIKNYEFAGLKPLVLEALSLFYLAKEDYQKVRELLMANQVATKESRYYIERSQIETTWASIYLHEHNYEEAYKRAIKGIEYSEKEGFITHRKYAYIHMPEILEALGDFKGAYYYLQKYMEIEREICNRKKEVGMIRLATKNREEGEKSYKLLYQQTQLLYTLGQKITSNLKKKEIFEVIASELKGLIKADGVQIISYKKESNVFVYELIIDKGKNIKVDPVPLKAGGVISYCIEHKREVVIRDITKEHHRYVEDAEVYMKNLQEETDQIGDEIAKSGIFVPLLIDENVIGVISVQSYRENFYNDKDLVTLKMLSTYIGIALENANLYEELQYAVSYDVLTKVFSRREVLRRSEIIAKNITTNEYMGALMLDIDNFKAINDTYGHLVGDQVLHEVATSIMSVMKEKGLVGRYGGEEFLIVMKHTKKQVIQDMAEQIRRSISEMKIEVGEGSVGVTTSVGCTYEKVGESSLYKMIARADKALYEAKHTGKNKVVVYEG